MKKVKASEELKKQKNNITFIFVSGRKEPYEKNLIEAREHYYTLPLYDKHENNINVIEFQKNSSTSNYLLYLIDRIFNKLLSLPFYMHKLTNKKNYRILKKSDHIFLVTESTGFSALPMLKVLKLFSSSEAKVHMFVMGLYSKKLKYKKLRFLHNLMINLLVYFLDSLFFLGKGELDNAKKITKNHKKLHFVPFSIDEDFWVSNNKMKIKDKEKIIFVGNDGNRDVDLLVQIAKELCSFEFIFVSNLETVKKINLDNVTVLGDGWAKGGLKDVELKKLYLDSKITILPLKESFQPSGQSVALQSMSLGIPVLISKTEGFWDKELFKDNKDIFFVKDNSLEGWVKRIIEVYKDEDLLEEVSNNSRNIVKNSLNLIEFQKKVKNIIKLS